MSASALAPLGVWRKHIALPQQHGSWVLWLGPYITGLGIGGFLRPGVLWLSIASLGAFLALQPLTVLVKALSGRRTRDDITPALFWLVLYSVLIATGALGLIITGNAFVLLLGALALPAVAWQLWLVTRKAERHALWAEVAGTSALALAAPAALWVGAGFSVMGVWLWLLCALQAGASIAHVYVLLAYRRMAVAPARAQRWPLARLSVVWHAVNVAIVVVLAALGQVPAFATFAFIVMLAESIYGDLLKPCIGAKPASIGVRQVFVALIFALLMITAYRLT
jgi:hypothetical protein